MTPASRPAERVTVAELAAAATAGADGGQRRILGIAGAPGSGKSTLAQQLADMLGTQVALVGLDGFHLSNAELHRLGRHERKGAADTFDAEGFINLLHRLRARDEPVVYAAVFDRDLEESIACAVSIPREVPVIITEGNYLLLEDGAWAQTSSLLDECWYLDPDEDIRVQRLMARHLRFGRSVEQAAERTHGSDQRNAELIQRTRVRADRVISIV